MKKLLSLFLITGMFAFLACGPSAADKAAAEKRVADSVAAVKQKFTQDSLATVEKVKADSIAAAAEKARVADSIAKAEAAAKKPVKKAKVTPKTGPTVNPRRPGATKVK